MSSDLKVLNPELFTLLRKRYGVVKVANVGQMGRKSYRPHGDRKRLRVYGGEEYRINCPKCGDIHNHFYVSYLFGTADKATKSKLLHMAFCQRCSANASDVYLADQIRLSFSKCRSFELPVSVDEVNVVDIRPADVPEGEFVGLHGLSPSHPARAWIEGRGYSAHELSTVWWWAYCYASPEPLMARRIYIPIYHFIDGVLRCVGYQTRAIPGLSVCETPKYWTMPGFFKSQTLYNLPSAMKHDVIVLTEGVTDAARVGLNAVSLFGKSLSADQHALLLKTAPGARIAVMLDADARASCLDIVQRLNTGGLAYSQHAFLVPLERGDPGDYSREELIVLIARYDSVSNREKKLCLP